MSGFQPFWTWAFSVWEFEVVKTFFVCLMPVLYMVLRMLHRPLSFFIVSSSLPVLGLAIVHPRLTYVGLSALLDLGFFGLGVCDGSFVLRLSHAGLYMVLRMLHRPLCLIVSSSFTASLFITLLKSSCS